MPQPKSWIPILFQGVNTDFTIVGNIWMEYFSKEITCNQHSESMRLHAEHFSLCNQSVKEACKLANMMWLHTWEVKCIMINKEMHDFVMIYVVHRSQLQLALEEKYLL